MTSATRERKETGRQSRTPLGRARQKLSAKEIPGYVCRWINDDGGRIPQAIEGGYNYVTQKEAGHIGESVEDGNTDIGSKVSKVVGKHPDGTPKRAFLMKIKKDWYDEDQLEKQAQVDAVDRAIREGHNPDGNKDPHQYVPSEGIKIQN